MPCKAVRGVATTNLERWQCCQCHKINPNALSGCAGCFHDRCGDRTAPPPDDALDDGYCMVCRGPCQGH